MQIKGNYGRALIFSNNVDEKAIEQVRKLCDQEFTKNSKIRIMPDIHVGAGCAIGTTMTISDKVVPNLVGVDIGCGVYVCRIGKIKIEDKLLRELDKIIKQKVPCGFAVRKKAYPYSPRLDLDHLKCRERVDLNRVRLSIGTLGGGNHFIELDIDSNGIVYLVIHSGSRHMGKQIAEYYQRKAAFELGGKVPRSLSYVSDKSMDDYIHDMGIAQKFADNNRKAIAQVIFEDIGFSCEKSFTTVHNYISLNEMILRKGAISAKKDEIVLIPINMKDGSIIAKGKGNHEWNCSAPHGAGRVMSRTQAKKQLSLSEFKQSMKGIYSTTISRGTIDEAPSVYKPMEEIVETIDETVEIMDIIRPVYNFKAFGG